MSDAEINQDELIRGLAMAAHYLSTYCIHQDHGNCRLTCKTCDAPCRCECHRAGAPTRLRAGAPVTDLWNLINQLADDEKGIDGNVIRGWLDGTVRSALLGYTDDEKGFPDA